MSRLLSLFVCLLLVFGFAAAPALADCPDGDSGGNVIDCTSDPGPENNDDSVEGDAGDDNITIEDGVTVGGAHGNGGDDTITNNGTSDGDIRGDQHYFEPPGDDLIVNNGSANSLQGDQAYGDGSNDGDDTLINNGSVDGSIFGDSTGNNGGNDQIVNNGNVGGDINGDNGYTPGGDDTIIVNGNVGGQVSGDSYGDSNNVGSGDDLIELQNGAAGGDDDLLLIDGDGLGELAAEALGPIGGHDTLVFNFSTRSESEYNHLIDQFTAAVASTSATGAGSLTFRGQTFQWINIEELRNLIRLIVAQSSGSGEVVLGTHDGRLNWQDVAAPAAIYCAPGGGVHVYAIGPDGSGVFLLGVDGATVAASQSAEAIIAQTGGATLNATSAGQINFSFNGYNFAFSASACALPA